MMKMMNKVCSGLLTAALLAGTGIAVSTTAAAKPSQQASAYTAVKGKTVYYKNCTAVRKAGKAPLYKGEPGYRTRLDRDKDGIACE